MDQKFSSLISCCFLFKGIAKCWTHCARPNLPRVHLEGCLPPNFKKIEEKLIQQALQMEDTALDPFKTMSDFRMNVPIAFPLSHSYPNMG